MSVNLSILTYITDDDAPGLHSYIDIPLETAQDACRTYRSIKTNFTEQVTIYPERKENLNKELRKLERSLLASILYHSAKHCEILIDKTKPQINIPL